MAQDYISFLRQFEYGNPCTGEDYLRIDYGYFQNQFYVSGMYNSFYFNSLFEKQDSGLIKHLLRLAGDFYTLPEDELSRSEFAEFLKVFIPKKHIRTRKIALGYLNNE